MTVYFVHGLHHHEILISLRNKRHVLLPVYINAGCAVFCIRVCRLMTAASLLLFHYKVLELNFTSQIDEGTKAFKYNYYIYIDRFYTVILIPNLDSHKSLKECSSSRYRT